MGAAADAALARLWRGVAVLAAALVGFGLILWVAANWDDFGRVGRFALLQGLVAVALVGAWGRPALRSPLGLVALLSIGSLLAYFGQTYQTGADPWQLFALWAALALPLALAVRRDLLWAPWALVAMTAVSLWAQTHTGHVWRVLPQDLPTHLTAWGASAAMAALLGPWLSRFTGAGTWAWRGAATLFTVMLTLTALGGLFSREIAPHFAIGLAMLALCTAWFGSRRGFDVFVFSALALGLNTLVLAGLARWLFDSRFGDSIAKLLLMGLVSAAMLALSVQWVLRKARAGRGDQPVRDQTPSTERPWPLVLLTALGAWLAALPLLGALGMLLGDMVYAGTGPYIIGGLLLALACLLLRSQRLPVFVEQLAMPLLLAGAGTLGFGLARDLPPQAAAALLCGLAVAIAVLAAGQRRWLQALLGAAAAGLLALALLPTRQLNLDSALSPWWALHGAMAVWLATNAAQRRLDVQQRPAWQALGTGWLLAVVAGMAAASGMAFLAGGVLGGLASDIAQSAAGTAKAQWTGWLPAAASVVLALAGAAVAARAWPPLRQLGCAGVAAVLAVLCGFLPLLGAVLLGLALMAAAGRWRLAAACALAAAWIVGSFYYQLAWPLATKAVVLVVAGALLAALARGSARRPRPASAQPAAATRRVGLLLSVCGIATLLLVNHAIWQKQQLIAHGQPVYVLLVPVDPRSLMQGDFMRLGFELPADPESLLAQLRPAQRPMLVAQRDARGVALPQRIDDGLPALAPGEFRMELTPKDGRWVLVTDAWFFREGEAQRWARARYGEFRVGMDGRALLVGLADAQLQAIR